MTKIFLGIASVALVFAAFRFLSGSPSRDESAGRGTPARSDHAPPAVDAQRAPPRGIMNVRPADSRSAVTETERGRPASGDSESHLSEGVPGNFALPPVAKVSPEGMKKLSEALRKTRIERDEFLRKDLNLKEDEIQAMSDADQYLAQGLRSLKNAGGDLKARIEVLRDEHDQRVKGILGDQNFARYREFKEKHEKVARDLMTSHLPRKPAAK